MTSLYQDSRYYTFISTYVRAYYDVFVPIYYDLYVPIYDTFISAYLHTMKSMCLYIIISMYQHKLWFLCLRTIMYVG